MINVLITGNLGYNGVWVTKLFNEKGFRTIGVDTHFYKNELYDVTPFLPTKQILKDIRDINEEDLKDVEVVVHLAALSNDALGEINPELTKQINCDATGKIARLAKKIGVKKFIYASSCSVYGIQDATQSANEKSPLAPLTAYAKAKVAAEEILKELHDETFRVVCMRNATMHGHSPKHRLDIVLNNLTAYAHLYNEIKILSDGTPWRPLLSVLDFARMVILLAERDAQHIVYNIGFNDENFQIKDLGEMIAKQTGATLSINQKNTPDERSYRVDFTRFAKEFLDFKMKLGVQESINELIQTYKLHNLTEEDFKGTKFFRIRTLKKLQEKNELNNNLNWEKKV